MCSRRLLSAGAHVRRLHHVEQPAGQRQAQQGSLVHDNHVGGDTVFYIKLAVTLIAQIEKAVERPGRLPRDFRQAAGGLPGGGSKQNSGT